uniref:Uncharacterized protein n=1 Tax=Pyramimonas orientalis virus TaxID=455367 RepID=A0A7M3UP98_POV01|nr:hypothetical protein HWQ62_00442 [Pyramimonas orientalis virus]
MRKGYISLRGDENHYYSNKNVIVDLDSIKISLQSFVRTIVKSDTNFSNSKRAWKDVRGYLKESQYIFISDEEIYVDASAIKTLVAIKKDSCKLSYGVFFDSGGVTRLVEDLYKTPGAQKQPADETAIMSQKEPECDSVSLMNLDSKREDSIFEREQILVAKEKAERVRAEILDAREEAIGLLESKIAEQQIVVQKELCEERKLLDKKAKELEAAPSSEKLLGQITALFGNTYDLHSSPPRSSSHERGHRSRDRRSRSRSRDRSRGHRSRGHRSRSRSQSRSRSRDHRSRGHGSLNDRGQKGDRSRGDTALLKQVRVLYNLNSVYLCVIVLFVCDCACDCGRALNRDSHLLTECGV